MGAVLLRARAELRSRTRSWVGLSLLVGLSAGLVIAAVAGARRADSAYERFLERQRAADVMVLNYPDPGAATFDPDTVERLPEVATAARAIFAYIGDSGALIAADGRLGRDVNRPKLVRGRLPRPDRIDEVAIGFERARLAGWDVGTSMPLIEERYAAEAARAGIRNIRLRVVGIVAVPGDFPPLEPARPSMYLTPAFHRAYADSSLLDGAGRAVIARLRRGADDLPAFRARLERLAGGATVSIAERPAQTRDAERPLELQAAALWVFAALLALTGVLVASQTLARQAFAEAADHAALRAVGMTRRQLWAVGLLRALAIGAAGAVVAVVLAVALSPLTPIGTLARTAEPDPGIRIDALVLSLGASGTILITVLLAAPAAWVAARGRLAAAADGGSAVARTLSRLRASAALVTGVRMALEPGRGHSAVPVRTTIAGVTVSVMVFAAALTFGSSSGHLLDTPRLYGWTWDVALANFEAPGLDAHGRRVLERDPAIASFSIGTLEEPLEIDGRPVDTMALEPVRGSVLPPVVEGRAPAASGEIVLGAKTMRSLGVEIGDRVTVGNGTRTLPMQVVGRGVVPATLNNTARLGRGALILSRDARRLEPGATGSDIVLQLAPGARGPDLVARLQERIRTHDLYEVPLQKPLDLVDFGRVRELPFVLAGLLAVLAAATLAHVLLSAVRRRRRELAVLKALGFVRAQVRTVVVAQSLTYACIALLVGVPLGVAAGRFAWNVFAERQGVVAEVVVPVPALAIVVPVALLLAVALALVPARRAAATRPGEVLRTE